MGSRFPHRKGQFRSEWAPIVKYRDYMSAVRYAKTAEPIEMSFGMLSQVDPRNHVLDGIQIPTEMGNFEGKGMPRHARRHSDVSCAKTAELIEMPFGLWSRVELKKHGLEGCRSPCERAILGEKTCPGMPDDTVP